MSRGDAQQQEMSTQLTMRVGERDGDTRKMTMTPVPNTVDDLVNWLKKAMDLDYNLRLQYEDPDFDGALINVSNISHLPEMPTIRIIPLLGLVPKPLRKGRCELHEGVTVNTSTSRGDTPQHEISTQKQLTMRVGWRDGDTRKMTMTPVPNTVDDLVNWLKKAMDLDYNLRLQYEDPDFDGALVNVSNISHLPEMPTIRIIPLLGLVPKPLRKGRCELHEGVTVNTSTSRGDTPQHEMSTQKQLTMRVGWRDGDTRKMTMTPVPNTVDDLVNWLKKAMDLDYNLRLQYEDPGFDGALVNVSNISHLPEMPTIRIIPLLGLVPKPLRKGRCELHEGVTVNTSTSRGDTPQHDMSTQKQLTMRVGWRDGDTRKMTMTPVPNTVDDLVNWLKKAMDLDYNLRLQYEDPDFDGALVNVSNISHLPEMPTIRIIPLLGLVPKPLRKGRCELHEGVTVNTSTSRGDTPQHEMSTQKQLTMRVISCEGDRRKMTMAPVPNTVDDLVSWLKKAMDLDYNFVLQYEDPDFNGALTHLSYISELPEKPTVRIIPLLDLVPVPLSELRHELLGSSPEDTEDHILPSFSSSLLGGQKKPWPEVFCIPQFSTNVEYRLRQGNQMYLRDGKFLMPTKELKHRILERLAEEIYSYKAYPNQWEIDMVAKALVEKHPCLREPSGGSGRQGWIYSLKFKMGNYRTKMRQLGRADVVVNSGKRGRNNADGEFPARNIKKPRKGELNYLPQFPEGMDISRLEVLRDTMVKEVQKKSQDAAFIKRNMHVTFALRREEIVKSIPDVGQIIQRWPALFTESQVCLEFNRIVDRNLKEEFFGALDGLSANFLKILRKKPGRTGQQLADLLDQTTIMDPVAIRCLVLRGLPIILGDDASMFFKSSSEDFSDVPLGILCYEDDCVGSRPSSSSALPQLNPSRVGIIQGGRLLMDTLPNLPHAMCLLFGFTYALHLQYPKCLKNTFTFIQQVMLKLGRGQLPIKMLRLKSDLAM